MKIILILIAVYIIYRLARRRRTPTEEFLRSSRPPGPAGARPPERDDRPITRPAPPKDREDMVYDEMCKSYIPKDGALTAQVGYSTYYFCSGMCRQQFLDTKNNPY
ncbi:MAG: hypothetical protein HY890_05285 [Deltaproteobacteria bacterium]|nr:hypothetical protein [Deltaproteobacteria bacterium]